MCMNMIVLTGVSKYFGQKQILEQINLTVNAGDIFGFLGPNGAGKTTTMRLISGFMLPNEGEITVDGIDVKVSPETAQKNIGYLPEGAPLYADMTPKTFLDFIAQARRIPRDDLKKRFDYVIEKTHIGKVLHQPIYTLSKGYQRRVGLAQALIHDPKILILDEPTDGLDPNEKHEVRTLIAQLASENKAILISTHILEEVEAVCNRVGILHQGRMIIDTTPKELLKSSKEFGSVCFSFTDPVPDGKIDAIFEAIRGLPHVDEIIYNAELQMLQVFPDPGKDILPTVVGFMSERNWPFREIKYHDVKLDRVFRELTSERGLS